MYVSAIVLIYPSSHLHVARVCATLTVKFVFLKDLVTDAEEALVSLTNKCCWVEFFLTMCVSC